MRRGLAIILILLLVGASGCKKKVYPLYFASVMYEGNFEACPFLEGPMLSDAKAYAAEFLGLTTETLPQIERPELETWLGASELYDLSADRRYLGAPTGRGETLFKRLYVSAATGVLAADGTPMDDAIAETVIELFSPEDGTDPETVLAYVDDLAKEQDNHFPTLCSVDPSAVNVSAYLPLPEQFDRLYTWFCVTGIYDEAGDLHYQADARAELFCGELDGGYGAWTVVYQVPPGVDVESYKIQAAWDALDVDMSGYPEHREL